MSQSVAFTERLIDVVITAGAGADGTPALKFGPDNGNTLTFSGHRIRSTITQQTLAMPMATIAIYGLSLAEMNQLASLANYFYASNNNIVTLLAGDALNGMPIAFEGFITSAFADFRGAPDVSFNILATSTLNQALAAVSPASYPGAAGIGTICQQIATQMGLTLENNGCGQVLQNQYLSGTLLSQLQSATRAANVNYIIEGGVLAIWPKVGYRTTQTNSVTIAPNSGLVGYPTYTNFGLDFRSLYNPNILFGTNVNVQSSLTPACGDWTVYNITHLLDSKAPDGNWFTDLQTSKPGFFPPVTSS